jgi:predicted O-methyltransferase YrrM
MAGSPLAQVKALYASGARGAGRALTRVGILGEEAPPRDERWKHWAFSLTRAYDSLAIAELDVPWWTYDATDAVESWISARPEPVRAFEWGSGASTLWLAGRVDAITTVEHHRGFADHIAPTLAEHTNITSLVVEPVESSTPKVPSAKEGHRGLDFADYVAAIAAAGGQFDLIVIDGRAREACLRAALPHLADGGIIVFDNTRRRRYREALAATPVTIEVHRGLTPTLPYPDETSLCRLTRP